MTFQPNGMAQSQPATTKNPTIARTATGKGMAETSGSSMRASLPSPYQFIARQNRLLACDHFAFRGDVDPQFPVNVHDLCTHFCARDARIDELEAIYGFH